MNFKTLILSAFLSLDFIFLSGQAIYYDYDDSGNREKRYIVLGKGNSSDDKTLKGLEESDITEEFEEINKTEEFKENIGELTIKIYPNPTKGQLSVEINGLDSDQTIDYQVYSQTGLPLETKRKNGYHFIIDMNRYPSGIYFLRLMIEDKISQWKIIKE